MKYPWYLSNWFVGVCVGCIALSLCGSIYAGSRSSESKVPVAVQYTGEYVEIDVDGVVWSVAVPVLGAQMSPDHPERDLIAGYVLGGLHSNPGWEARHDLTVKHFEEVVGLPREVAEGVTDLIVGATIYRRVDALLEVSNNPGLATLVE